MRLVKIRTTALHRTIRWQVACLKCFMMNTQDNDNDEDYEDEDQEEQEEELTQPKRKKSVINFNNFFPASMLFFMMYGPYGEAAYNFGMTYCLTMDTKAIDMAAKRNRNLNAKSLTMIHNN